jgi:hypothetical protein
LQQEIERNPLIAPLSLEAPGGVRYLVYPYSNNLSVIELSPLPVPRIRHLPERPFEPQNGREVVVYFRNLLSIR